MFIIKAGKKESDDKQKLISSLNRGGLWLITEQADKLLKKTEKQFRLLAKPGVQRIDFVTITNKSVTDSDVLSNYNLMVADADCKADDHVAKDVLHCIINLYVQVRSFSTARDIIQKYKVKSKQNKNKSLRKEIS